MPTVTWRIFAIVAALWTSGCSLFTGPDFPKVTLQTNRLFGQTPDLVVSTGPGTATISGWIGLNEPCYTFAGNAHIVLDSLVVTLVATRRTGFCLQDLAAYSYSLSVENVPPGDLVLRLIYDRIGNPTYTETVLVQEIQVQ